MGSVLSLCGDPESPQLANTDLITDNKIKPKLSYDEKDLKYYRSFNKDRRASKVKDKNNKNNVNNLSNLSKSSIPNKPPNENQNQTDENKLKSRGRKTTRGIKNSSGLGEITKSNRIKSPPITERCKVRIFNLHRKVLYYKLIIS